jgi:hypothetical protein
MLPSLSLGALTQCLLLPRNRVLVVVKHKATDAAREGAVTALEYVVARIKQETALEAGTMQQAARSVSMLVAPPTGKA